MNPTRVLLAVDESAASAQAARRASILFGASAEFLVIRVSEVPGLWAAHPFGVAAPLTADEWQSLVEPDEEEIRRRVEEAGVAEAEVLVEIGDPVSQICDAAEEHDVDVIVVGSHHRGFLERLLSPSVSGGVVRTSHRPVLVVPEQPSGGS